MAKLPFTRAGTAVGLILAASLSGSALANERGGTSAMIEVYEAYAVYKMGRFDEAFEMYKELAERGVARAMLNVAHMYAQGEGVEQDRERALHWYTRGAEAGDTTSMLETGEAYRDGRGTAVDMDEADRWFRRAAESGNSEAQWIWGESLYQAGDRSEGLEWIERSARDGGHGEARRFLSALRAETGDERQVSDTERSALLATQQRIDDAARNLDPAGIVAPVRDDARIRVRLPNSSGWDEMDRSELQALWQATFDQIDDYRYQRGDVELTAVEDGIVATSRIREDLDGADGGRRLEIHETAEFRMHGEQAEIHRLELDIREAD